MFIAGGVAYRERHRQPVRDRKLEIELNASRRDIALKWFARVGSKPADKYRRPDVFQEKAGATDFAKANWRQIPLENGLQELRAAKLVDFESGHAVILAIALLIAVVDVVIAETAEVEVAQRIQAITVATASRRVEPDRRVLPGQCKTEVKANTWLGQLW